MSFGSIIQDMVIDMNDEQLHTLAQIGAFLDGAYANSAISSQPSSIRRSAAPSCAILRNNALTAPKD